MKSIFLVVFDHKHGTDMFACRSRRSAERVVISLAENNFSSDELSEFDLSNAYDVLDRWNDVNGNEWVRIDELYLEPDDVVDEMEASIAGVQD